MIIKQNPGALRSLHKLQQNERAAGKTMEKLATGLRITKAADDAANLVISEKMRAHIRGLDQAERNIQDGQSMIQTAESGLSLILDPHLQRARELAIQAANGTLTSEDRNAIQRGCFVKNVGRRWEKMRVFAGSVERVSRAVKTKWMMERKQKNQWKR